MGVAANGDFVVTWRSDYQDGDYYGSIFAQRFRSTGDFSGTELQVNSFTPVEQRFPSIGVAADGRFVIAWESDGDLDEDSDIFAQRFGSDGDPLGGEFQVNTHGRLLAGGAPAGDAFRINASRLARAAALPFGGSDGSGR